MTQMIEDVISPIIHRVHIISDQTKVTPAAKECVGTANTYPMIAGADAVMILAHSPKRKCAQVLVTGPGIVAISRSKSDCESTIVNAAGQVTGNVFLINGITAPITFENTSEWWAIAVGAPSGATNVSVLKETEQ